MLSNDMPSKSKIKGSSWEREISKFLTETYNKPFLRVVGSGAFVGGKNTARKADMDANQIKSHRGDINPPDDWIRFNAEAKNYDDMALHQIFSGKCGKLDEWLDQLVTVSQPDDVDILFIKLTRKCKLVAVRLGPWIFEGSYAVYTNKTGSWIICDFDKFFEQNSERLESLATAKNCSIETISKH